jgi:hypothetical protein
VPPVEYEANDYMESHETPARDRNLRSLPNSGRFNDSLRRVSLDPSSITKIAAAALVLLQLECDRTL